MKFIVGLIVGILLASATVAGAATRDLFDIFPGDHVTVSDMDLSCTYVRIKRHVVCARDSTDIIGAAVWIAPRYIAVGVIKGSKFHTVYSLPRTP